jgi:gliding motility-associated-like protein
MKKPLRFFGIVSCLIFSIFSNAQQNSTNCPGVPGACGYPGNHSTTRTSNGNLNPQDGSGTLGNSYNFTKCGLNFIEVSNRLGQRFSPPGVPQPAPYVVSGLSTCDTIEKAFLYVEGSGTGAAQTATIQPPIGPTQNFPLTLIGSGPDKCWSYAGTQTYRADVTSVINGNGTYNLSGIFTNPPNAGEDMDGATLLIIYSDRTAAYQGTMIIDDGCIEVSGGVANYNMNYPAVCGATQNAQAFCCVGDIQFPVTSLTMNGTNAPFTWNWWNYVNVATTENVGQTTSNFNLNTGGDCFNLCVVGMYWQTTTCSTCPLQSANLSVAATSTLATCSACDGSATANPSPAGTYTYSWNPSGQTTQTATNLCAGTYTVTVTGGCLTATTTITVGNNSTLTASLAQTDVFCNGGSTGSATVTPAGGLGPYTYSWAPSGGNAATASGLSVGSYTCTITDANGCTYFQVATITQPPGMNITMTNVDVLCNGQSNGSSTAAVTGGAPNYTYAWSPTGGNAASATNLAGGNYTLTVTDANGCAQTQPVTINEPAPLLDSMSVINVGCSATGSATAWTSGGTGPYTYQWQDFSTSSTDNNLTVGSYTVLITDANGCSLVDTATITSVSAITSTQTVTNITCFGAGNGSATVTPSGGTAPYTYFWSPTGGNNATATGLSAGQYTVTITDANGCQSTATVTVVEPSLLTSTSSSSNVSCNGGSDGTGTVTPAGGTPGYTYAWAPSGSGSTAQGLTAGSYTITVSDANGCVTTQTITITQPSALIAQVVNDSVCYGTPSQISASASGGVAPYTYSWSNGPTTQVDNINITSTTSFTVTITDANSCTNTGVATVFVNPLPVASITTNAINGIYTVDPAQQLCFYGPSNGVTSWLWNLNGVGTSIQQSPCVNITAADTGNYCADLIVQNSFGCLDTASVCIEISNVSYSIPNVYTPNGDGNNDYFFITNSGMKSLHCVIYDRWGVWIYEWDSPTGYWDGRTKNGKEAVDGVYYWTVDMMDYSGKEYGDHGFVHLIRGGPK